MDFEDLIITILIIALVLGLPIGIGVGIAWHSAGIKAQLINDEFGTEYTKQDIFWGESTIRKLILGQKQRINLGGKLKTEEVFNAN